MPNLFAYTMVLLWPFIATWLFKKYQKDTALILLVVVPYLLLPMKTGIDLPALPPLTKTSIAAITAFYLFYKADKSFKLLPESDMARRILILMLVFPIFTWLGNTEALYYGPRYLSALSFADILSISVNHFCLFYVPLILAARYLRSEESHKNFVRLLILIGLVHALPVLYEARMSPQLHSQIYGFFPHDWRQQIRQGGFRPVVFLGHGLMVAMFTCVFVIASFTAYKEKLIVHPKLSKPVFIAIFSIILLLACKSLGVLVYAIVVVPCILLFKPRLQIKVSLVLVIIVFLFPFFRNEGYIPTDIMTNYFKGIDEDRASSLKYRFDNEDTLLEKANQRPFFGWGTWGRNRVFDPINGVDLATTDGYWIITFGIFGWIGYLAIFGSLVWPVIYFSRVSRRLADQKTAAYTACLCLILAVNLIDLLPNSSISQLSALLAGAILGRAEDIKKLTTNTAS